MEERNIERVNKVNEFISTCKTSEDINTIHVVFMKVIVDVLKKKGFLKTYLEEVERIKLVNDAMNLVCEDFYLDRIRLKSFLLTKINKHFDGVDILSISKAGDLSSDHGIVNKELVIKDIIVALFTYLEDKFHA